jgi:bla regulator protein blaR1
VTQAAANPLVIILLAVWFCGFAVSIVMWFRCWQRMRTARSAATPLHLGLPIPAMSSSTRVEPGVFGIRKPVLLLPEGIADRLTPAQLNAVLAHEMCHVQRHDNLTAAIHMVVETVFWFYPLAWWIRARLVEERERACDETVLQSGSDAEAYAEGILNVCKFYVESPLACASGIAGADLKKRVVRIMTEHVEHKLDFSRKLLLSGTVAVALAIPLAFGFVSAPQLSPRTQVEDADTKLPEFEVATIKLNKSGDLGGRFAFTANGFSGEDIPLTMLLKLAYGVEDDQIVGVPSWLKSQRYDIAAKVDVSDTGNLGKLSIDQRKRMIRPLLSDRFNLKFHREAKSLSAYVLVIAKKGPKLRPSQMDGPSPLIQGHRGLRMMGRGYVVGQGVPIELMPQVLSDLLGRTVVDKTGLTGNYDFTLKWTPDEVQTAIFNKTYVGGNPDIDNAPLLDSSGPSIFTALQEQLGLKLELQKSRAQILVIDHVEKPSEN